MKKNILFAVIFFALTPIFSLNAQKLDDSEKFKYSKLDNILKIEVKLEDLYSNDNSQSSFIVRSPKKPITNEKIKIDKNTIVELILEKPNLFRYDFKFEDNKELIESYNYLDSLLETVVKVFGGGVQSNDALKDWEEQIEKLTNEYNLLLSTIPKSVYLTNIDHSNINISLKKLIEKLKVDSDFSKAKDDAKAYLGNLGDKVTPIQMENYRELRDNSTSLISMIKRVVKIFEEINNGITHTVNKQKSGTIVTINVKPEINNIMFLNDDIDRVKDVSIQYFVQSGFNVHFHTGVSFSGIKEITLEKLQEGELDAFKIVESKDVSTDLVAFLSVPLISLNEVGTSSMDFSLGTDYKNFGERIFFGLSCRIKNIGSVTGGAVLDTKSVDIEGNGNIGEVINNFEIKNVFGGFFSISINAF